MSASLAIWALTPKGAILSRKLADQLAPVDRFISFRLSKDHPDAQFFSSIAQTINDNFTHYSGHIFIMATGIVVRSIACLLVHKTKDPAVVVVDEAGKFAISLIAGHLGGANELALQVAQITRGQAVITTATDVNQVPAIDLLAKEKKLKIDNPDAIKSVNISILMKKPIAIYDPYKQILNDQFKVPPWPAAPHIINADSSEDQIRTRLKTAAAGVCIDDKVRRELGARVLVLRPSTLVVGMGCNRNTSKQEMQDLLERILKKFDLAIDSVDTLASIDLKADEPGLLQLARQFNFTLTFFTRSQLKQVDHVPTPSAVVNQHIGVNSVCEAAAILGARNGNLIVPKHKSPNVTIAIARRGFTSSVSDQETLTTSPNGQ